MKAEDLKKMFVYFLKIITEVESGIVNFYGISNSRDFPIVA